MAKLNGFSEREYEFGFNCEFIRLHSSIIAGMPFIPTLQEENKLGYDVELKLRNLGFSYSLFVQYKVSSFVVNKTSANANIFKYYAPCPYYYFSLHQKDGYKQHNLLCELSGKNEKVYYISPLFSERLILYDYFMRHKIMSNSVAINPSQIGKITDPNRHKISYDPNGTKGYYHSEAKAIDILKFGQVNKELKKIVINEEYISKLLEKLTDGIPDKQESRLSSLNERSDKTNLYKCVYLLRDYYKLHWIVF